MLMIFLLIFVLVTRFSFIEGKNYIGCKVLKFNKVKSKSKFWFKITTELNNEAKSNVLYLSEKVDEADIRNELFKESKKMYPKSGSYFCDYSIEKDKVLELITSEQYSLGDEAKISSTEIPTNKVEVEDSIELTDLKKETEPLAGSEPLKKKEESEGEDSQEKKTKDDIEFTDDETKPFTSDEPDPEKPFKESNDGVEFTDEKESKPFPGKDPTPGIEEGSKSEKEVPVKMEDESTAVDDHEGSETVSDEVHSGKSEVERIKEVLQEREDERKEELEGTVNKKLQEIFEKKKTNQNGKTGPVTESFVKKFFLRFTKVRWMVLLWVVFKFFFALAVIAGFALALRIIMISRFRPTPPLIRNMTASELHTRILRKIEDYEIPKIKPIVSGYDRTMNDFFDKHEYDRYITKKVPTKRIEELMLLKFILKNDGEVLKELFPETPYLLTFDTLTQSFKEHKRTFHEFSQLIEGEIDSKNSVNEEEKDEEFGIGTSLFCVLWNGKSVFTERSTYFHVLKLEYHGSMTSHEKLLEEQDIVVSHNPFHSKSKDLSFSKKEKEEFEQKKIRRKKNRISEHSERFLAEMGMYISYFSQVKDPIQIDIITNHDVRSMDDSGGPDSVDDYQEFRYEQLGVDKYKSRRKSMEEENKLSARDRLIDTLGRTGRPEIGGSKSSVESSRNRSENLTFSSILVEDEELYDEEEEEAGMSSTFSSNASTDSLLSMTSEEGDGGLTRQRRDSVDETLQLDKELEGDDEEDEFLKMRLKEMIENDELLD